MGDVLDYTLVSKKERTEEGWEIHVTQSYNEQHDFGHIMFSITEGEHLLYAQGSSGFAPRGNVARDGCEAFMDVRFALKSLRRRRAGGDV